MEQQFTIKQLEAMLKEAHKREDDAKAEKKAATPVIWEFTIMPSDRHGDKIWDDNCCFYEIKGRIVNEAEAKAVGHHIGFSGSMVYVYNKLSKQIVCDVGGGTSFINASWGGDSESARKAFDEVNAFLIDHPEGGDITDIVNRHKQRMGFTNG
jgi:hypothetical protein